MGEGCREYLVYILIYYHHESKRTYQNAGKIRPEQRNLHLSGLKLPAGRMNLF